MPAPSDALKVKAILSFWFAPMDWDRHHSKSAITMRRNFKLTPAAVASLRDQFSGDLDRLLKGRLEHWKQDDQAALAYIILSD